MNDRFPSSITKEALLSDLEVVVKAQFASDRMSSRKALVQGLGSYDDAERFSHAQDPLGEAMDFILFQSTKEAAYNTLTNEALAKVFTAEELVVSVVKPEYFGDGSRPFPAASELGLPPEIDSSVNTVALRPYSIIPAAINEIHTRTHEDFVQYPDQSLDRMLRSAEMMDIARTQFIMFDQHFPGEEFPTYNDPVHLARYCSELRNLVVTQALILPDSHISMERLNIGLKAMWRQMAVMLDTNGRLERPELSRYAVQTMVETLQTVFLDQQVLESPRFAKSDVKGLLHELIWMLDSYMEILCRQDTGELGVLPARSGKDRPLINRPRFNRGYDYRVMKIPADTPTSELIVSDVASRYVQLKSGTAVGNPDENYGYHPDINVLFEGNFLDMHPRRLAVKLEKYRAIIDGGFSAEASKEILDKYVLKSVRLALSEVALSPAGIRNYDIRDLFQP